MSLNQQEPETRDASRSVVALQRFLMSTEHGAAGSLLQNDASQKSYVVDFVVDDGGDRVVEGGVNNDRSSDDCCSGHGGNDGSGGDRVMVDGVVNGHGSSDHSGSSDDSGSNGMMMTVHDFWKKNGKAWLGSQKEVLWQTSKGMRRYDTRDVDQAFIANR